MAVSGCGQAYPYEAKRSVHIIFVLVIFVVSGAV